MTTEGLKDHVKETLGTTRKSFGLGEMRILAVLFLLMLAPAGARPLAILLLTFGDILLSLARDPADPHGPPRVLIRMSPEHTKRWLGAKDQ